MDQRYELAFVVERSDNLVATLMVFRVVGITFHDVTLDVVVIGVDCGHATSLVAGLPQGVEPRLSSRTEVRSRSTTENATWCPRFSPDYEQIAPRSDNH